MDMLDKTCIDLLREADHDYVGLWEVINAVERDFKPTSVDEKRSLTMRIVQRLLASGLEAVELRSGGSGCIPWSKQDIESVLSRIDAEWDELGHEPDIGDIVWFNRSDN